MHHYLTTNQATKSNTSTFGAMNSQHQIGPPSINLDRELQNRLTGYSHSINANRYSYAGGLRRSVAGNGWNSQNRQYGQMAESFIGRNTGKGRITGGFASKMMGIGGHEMSHARWGLTAGLGALAISKGANMMNRMRYGDYSGAMMQGAMAAAAGAGAYAAYMGKGAIRSHLRSAVAGLLRKVVK